MTERADEIAHLISLENGKALPDARGETAYAAEFFRWYAEEAVRASGSVMTAPSGANKIVVLQQPVGICVLVTPWNFPAAMATRKIGPALAAGCTVILKPASDTPLTALLMAKILDDAGVPAGVVNVLPARRSGAVVSAMLHDPRVRKLSFTGSTEVGRVLLREAADQVVNCSMELGGNAPFLVFEDADLDAAVDGAMIAKMRNGGEACTAANRFYVHADVADEFSRRLAERMAALQRRTRHRRRHRGRPARQRGVGRQGGRAGRRRRRRRGARGPGRHPPRPRRLLLRPDRAARRAPGRRHPRRGDLRTGGTRRHLHRRGRRDPDGQRHRVRPGLLPLHGDLARGLRVSERLDSGMVGLNRGIVSDPAAPFGGTKQSGVGREGGHEGMLDYLESKYVAVSW